MVIDFRLSATVMLFGLLAFLCGLTHLSPRVAAWDKRVFLRLNQQLASRPLVKFFQFIWPLGTTPFALALLGINFLINGWRIGLIVIGVYAVSITVERLIKYAIKRPRPFTAFPEVSMKQPRRPSDPSFPSGDAMRAWFLALVIPASFGLTWPVFITAILVASCVTIGRIALGVHYPLDILGGMGIGILFAGINLFLLSWL